MKRSLRILIFILCFATLFCGTLVFADNGTQKQGWYNDDDGKERYYVSGSYVTGSYKVGSHTYLFAEDGECLGAYDGYKNVGTAGVMDTQIFKDAVAAKDPYINETFDAGRLFRGQTIPAGGIAENTATFLDDDFIPDILQTVVRQGCYSIKQVSGSNADNLYYEYKHLPEGVFNGSLGSHCYMNIFGINGTNIGREDFIIDIEIRLDTLPSGNTSLITVSDRSNSNDPNETKFSPLDSEGLLSVNSDGYLYSPKVSGRLFGRIYGTNDFTRISIAIHRSTNSFDIYCNGILMIKDVILYDNSVQTPETFDIEECRMFEITGSTRSTATICINNIYLYKSEEPICLGVDAPKNGFIEDGAYLRYYDNNAIVTGRIPVNGTFFGQTLVNSYTVFESGNGAAFIGSRYTVKNGDVTVSSGYIDQNKFTVPKAVDIDGKHFVAWNVNGTVMESGSSFRVSSDVAASALGIGFSTVNGAALSTEKKSSEMIFAAKISKEDYAALTSFGIKIEPHIITVPTETVRAAHGYIKPEHLAATGLEAPVDTVSSGWLDENDTYYFYGASVSGIEDILKEYSVIAYLRLTLPSGAVMDIYADYDEGQNSRTLYQVASDAYNDRTTVKEKDRYDHLVTFDGIRTYSPYGASVRKLLKNVLDSIVVLKTDNNSVDPAGSFYDSPYTISYEVNEENSALYDVTLTKHALGWDAEKITTVIVDGEALPPESITAEDKGFKFSVDSGKIYLYEAGSDPTESTTVQSKVLVSATDDPGVFSGTASLPTSYEGEQIKLEGQSKIAYWDFTRANVNLGGASAIAALKKSDGKYDFSSIKSIRFSVYVPEKAVGSTFLILFNSENPSTEGSDYYSSKINLIAKGWQTVTIVQRNVSASRSPLGWDNITSVSFTSTGWEQTNDASVRLYISDIYGYNEDVSTGNSTGICNAVTKKGAAMFTIGGFAGSVNGKTYKTNPYRTDAVVFEENDTVYLPVNVFALSIDKNAVYYQKSGIVKYTCVIKNEDDEDEYDDDEDEENVVEKRDMYIFSPGNTYKVNGEYKQLQKPAISRNGGLFISAEDAMAIYGYTLISKDRMGLIILSNEDLGYNSTDNMSSVYDFISELMYVRPSGEKMYSDLMAYSGGQHPAILVDKAGFDDLRYYAMHDATLQSYIKKLESKYGIGSSKFRAEPEYFRRTDGIRLLSVSRTVMENVLAWGSLYQVAGYDSATKAVLVERVWAEVEAVCSYFDVENDHYSWNPSHYLDTGEMTYAMAIAYDWFYDAWTPEQRTVIAKAIYEYGLCTTSVIPGGSGNYGLASATNNWNGVCNGGIMAGALAIVNDPYIVAMGLVQNVVNVMDVSIKAIEKGMWVYGPDGGYEEGPGYWSYGTTYCQVFISALNSACGTNYGIFNTPGFAYSAYFTTYLGNANTTWGFHDGGSGDSNPSIAAWFAGLSGDGNLNAIRRQGIEKGWCGVSVYDVMYFNPHIIANSITLTLDAYYSLDTIMTFRSSWDTSNNIFAGLHGGDNQASHGDLDIGNFVINVNGVYMLEDLGADSYNMVGYFGAYRWSYYRKRTEGQNTLVMITHGESWKGKTGKPEYYIDLAGNVVTDKADAAYMVSGGVKYTIDADGKRLNKVGNVANTIPNPVYYGQDSKAISKMIAFKSGVNSAYGIVDMTPAYRSAKGTMQRGLYMTNNRSTVVIQDEGDYSISNDVWWFAHTRGDITVSDDGKSAFITRNGICLYAELVSDPSKPNNAKFSVMNAVSLDSEYVGDNVDSGVYTGETENSNSAFKKLVVTATNTKSFNVAVAFTVISSPAAAPEFGTLYKWTPMSEWKAD